MGWKSSVRTRASEGEGGDWGRPLQVAPSSPHFLLSQAPDFVWNNTFPRETNCDSDAVSSRSVCCPETQLHCEYHRVTRCTGAHTGKFNSRVSEAISLEITFSANATTSCPHWERTKSATLDHSGVDDCVCVPPTFTLSLAQNGPYWFDASHARQSCNTKGKITNSYTLFF